METENKYKTFGKLKVGDKIIAVDVTTNDKNVFKVINIKPRKDCYIVEFANYGIDKPNPFCTYNMILNVDDYVTSRDGKKWISDADNADKIIEEVRREQEQESKRKRLEAIREQARKNPPRFITLNTMESDVEFVANVDSIRTVWKNENFSIVYFKKDGLKISVSNDYEEIKAKLGL